MKIRFLLALTLAFLCHSTWAGLLASGTRVIYQEGASGQTLMLANTNPWPVIVQSWVDNGEGDPQNSTAPFVILPAVLRLDASARQGIRIIYNHAPLPKDRESVFWLNLYEIPPQTSGAASSSRMMLTMNTQMKLFYRPVALTTSPEESLPKLRFRLVNDDHQWFVECNNPTPFHVSFSSLALHRDSRIREAESGMGMMVSPYAAIRLPLRGSGVPDALSTIHYRYINDKGAIIDRDARLEGE
ncbi:molecular chaperone [Klebsiella aerogenes]|nr:molecular chaperone [Klebsiella aerogenes]